ncbi:MAG TPA: hypothetical protein VHS59_03770 [Bacillota bacterium]|nr:hypothetical protein [Bacillota bacterium]
MATPPLSYAVSSSKSPLTSETALPALKVRPAPRAASHIPVGGAVSLSAWLKSCFTASPGGGLPCPPPSGSV